MSLDKSLKTAASLTRHRNVLRRHERVEILKEEERWTDGQRPLGLPKVAHRKVNVGAKEKHAKTAEETKPEKATEEKKEGA